MHKGRQFRAALPELWYKNHVQGDHVPARLFANGLWYTGGQLVEMAQPLRSNLFTLDYSDLLYEWTGTCPTNFGAYRLAWTFRPLSHDPDCLIQMAVADINTRGFVYTWKWTGAQGGFYIGSDLQKLELLDKVESAGYQNANPAMFIRGIRYSEE